MVHKNIHIKDINITFVGITAKHIEEGKVGRDIYIYIIFPHSTCIQIFLVILVYMGWGIDFAVQVNHYKRSSSMETKKSYNVMCPFYKAHYPTQGMTQHCRHGFSW